MSKNACASCEGLNVESIIKTNNNKSYLTVQTHIVLNRLIHNLMVFSNL